MTQLGRAPKYYALLMVWRTRTRRQYGKGIEVLIPLLRQEKVQRHGGSRPRRYDHVKD